MNSLPRLPSDAPASPKCMCLRAPSGLDALPGHRLIRLHAPWPEATCAHPLASLLHLDVVLALDLDLLGQDDHRLLANLLQAHACARAMLLATSPSEKYNMLDGYVPIKSPYHTGLGIKSSSMDSPGPKEHGAITMASGVHDIPGQLLVGNYAHIAQNAQASGTPRRLRRTA